MYIEGMLIKEMLAAALLFWPVVVVTIGFCFIFTLVFAVFVGSTVAIILLIAYAIYTGLREYGWFDWIVSRWKEWNEKMNANMRDSFKLQQPLESMDEPALYICYPHGLYGFSWFVHFCGCFSDWPAGQGKRPRLAIHSVFFRIPFVRELMVYWRCIEATEESIVKVLEGGESVAIVLGGVEELRHTNSRTPKIILEKRTGYARIAAKSKVRIIPLFTEGETELFPAIQSPLWDSIQEILYKWLHLATPLPTRKSITAWVSIVKGPLKKALVTHFLDPVKTEQKSIQEIKKDVRKSLIQFRTQKNIAFDIIA